MSKKTNINKDNRNNKVNKEKKEHTKFEKIGATIIFSIGAILIILTIFLNINYHGDKDKIAKRFDSLTYDNVYTWISYDDVMTKLDNLEDFELVLVNNKQENSNYFVYCVDALTKYLESNDKEIGPIYMLYTSNLKEDQMKLFKNRYNKELFNGPCIIHFGKELKSYSTDLDCSTRYKLENYKGNYYDLIFAYFKNNYNI